VRGQRLVEAAGRLTDKGVASAPHTPPDL
jgi:hypothetical protein